MKSFSYFDILAVALTLTNQLFNIGSFALKHIPVQLENCRTSVAPSTHTHTHRIVKQTILITVLKYISE